MVGLIEAVVLLEKGESGKKWAMAQRLAGQVLGAPRLPLETKVLFLLIKEMVQKEGREVRFNRERIRKYTGWNQRLVKIHVDRLVRLKYLECEKNLLFLRKRKLVAGRQING